jgi:hypothetical protein
MMPQYDRKKIIKTIILIVLALTILVPTFYRTVYESGPFRAADSAGTEYVDEAFNRALVAFALARATNAIISVVQDSEIDIAPAGIGVTIAIGEALDPVNDMIERFSWVMLVSLVSLGIQKLLIDISPWISIKLFLLPALALLATGLWFDRGWALKCRYIGVRLVFLALLVRFCVPVAALANDQVYRLFLEKHYTEAVSGIEQGNVALKNMDPLSDERGRVTEGFWNEMQKKVEQAKEAVNLQHRISRMKSRMAGMVENLLQMIAVFILSTVLLPIGFLWLMVRLFRLVSASDSLLNLERVLINRITGSGVSKVAAGAGSETVHPGRNGEQPEVDEKDEDIKSDH